jgi:SPP1 gp7 family putative phage head morphogenesis protein
MLTDGDNVVDFKTFRANIDNYRAQALGIDEQYNSNWLYTEYTNAVNSGLAAKRWKEFEETADIFPNLEYRTAGDANVRASHQELNGIIKPINDPFWDTYYPPNDWGCRCRCRPTNESPTKAPLGGMGGEIPELFRNNVGKTGAIFNESHPYFTSNGISKSKTFATVRNFETTAHYEAQLPKYKQLNAKYKTLSAINELGGSIHQEAGFIPAADILGTARKLSLLGDSVVLLNPAEPQASALVQGIKAYFGSAKTASEIANTIAVGKDVAGVFTIDLATTVKSSAVKSALAGFKNNPRFKSAIFLKSGKKCVITAKDLATKNFEPLKSIGL